MAAGCVKLRPGVPLVTLTPHVTSHKRLWFADDLYYVECEFSWGTLLDRLGENATEDEEEQQFALTETDARVVAASSVGDVIAPEWPQPYLTAIGVDRAWKLTLGRGASIGTIDRDFDSESGDLSPGWDKRRSGWIDRPTGDPSRHSLRRQAAGRWRPGYGPIDSHGTACACLAAGARNGLLGVGVAPEAQLVGFALGSYSSTIAVARAIAYLADPGSESESGKVEPGADVLCCSAANSMVAGRTSWLVNAALAFAEKKGVVLVYAVSNTDEPISDDHIASHPFVIATASVDAGNRRPGGACGEKLHCVVPTYSMVLTAYGGGQYRDSGNSWSAPVVSGAIALATAHHGRIAPSEVRRRLRDACIPLGEPACFGSGLLMIDRFVAGQ